jgi:hypothetical protein
MPISLDPVKFSSAVWGEVVETELNALSRDTRIKTVVLRADSPRATWEALNDVVFKMRADLRLAIDSFFPGGADLSSLVHMEHVRRLCIASSGPEKIRSIESIASLPNLELLQIGSSSLESFDVLNLLPPDRLRELWLKDTLPKRPSLQPVARLKSLQVLHIHGHSTDLEELASLRSLRQLTLNSIQLKDFVWLKAFPNLASFSFILGSVKRFDVLGELHQLRHLSLFHSRSFNSLDFLSSMRSSEMLELGNLPNVQRFPDLSQLAALRRIGLTNLKRLESLEGLAKAPALHTYLHTVVSPRWTPEHFRCLLQHPTLRQFTAIVGSKKKDDPIRELAAQFGKSPVAASTEAPFNFVM